MFYQGYNTPTKSDQISYCNFLEECSGDKHSDKIINKENFVNYLKYYSNSISNFIDFEHSYEFGSLEKNFLFYVEASMLKRLSLSKINYEMWYCKFQAIYDVYLKVQNDDLVPVAIPGIK
ncbi:MAG: hypothetical protein MHPSP_000232 [Paramarteilia canceri]